MPYIQFNDQQFPLGATELTVGAFEGAAVRLPGNDPTARAVFTLGAGGTGIIRRGSADAVVLVNGVQLGAEPSPVLHGDKIEVGGHALRYGDDWKAGSTRFSSSAGMLDAVKARATAPRSPTTATGGRFVSLVDGREYAVPDAGVTFGREIGNDIVIASAEVSRRHAQVTPGEDGYVLTDTSTNGVFVNAVRVEKTQVLGRGDVVKIGPEEFRFYADTAKPSMIGPSITPTATPAIAPTPPPPPASPSASVLAPSVPPVHAELTRRPVAPSVATTPKLLATLEVINKGPMEGKKFELFTPLTNIGRGAHNDVALNDDSVSDSHAKILKREGAWWIVDEDSTNGTYIGGRRVQGEQQLVGAPDVRCGGIKMIFRPEASPAEDEGKGTRAIATFNVETARKIAAAARGSASTPKPAPAGPETPPLQKKKGCAMSVAFLVVSAAAGATTLLALLAIRG